MGGLEKDEHMTHMVVLVEERLKRLYDNINEGKISITKAQREQNDKDYDRLNKMIDKYSLFKMN